MMRRTEREGGARRSGWGFALAGAALLVIGTPGAVWAAGEGEAPGANLFGINLGLSFWTVVVFLILLFLLSRFAWGPILDQVNQRESRIQGALDEAAARQAEAQRLLDEHKRQLADARRQAQEIVAEGRTAGENVRREIEEKAREEGQALLERARREIEREKEAALAELRKESVELAMAVAGRLMHERLDQDRDRELVLSYLDELTEASPPGGGDGSDGRRGSADA